MANQKAPLTILGLPWELQERILMEAIVGELRDRKLHRYVWRQSADQVAFRLRTVCPDWDEMIRSDYFQDKLYKLLDSYTRTRFQLNVLVKHWIQSSCVSVAAMEDEIFMLCHPRGQHTKVNVCDLDALQVVKRSVRMDGVTSPICVRACGVSHCIYVMHKNGEKLDICRLTKEEDVYKVSSWSSCDVQMNSRMTVSADGSVILYQGPEQPSITVLNRDSTLRYEIKLENNYAFVRDIFQKMNGNFVIVAAIVQEVNRQGKIVNMFESPRRACEGASQQPVYAAVDMHDRVLTVAGRRAYLFDADYRYAEVSVFSQREFLIRSRLYELTYFIPTDQFLLLDFAGDAEYAHEATAHRPGQSLSICDVREAAI